MAMGELDQFLIDADFGAVTRGRIRRSTDDLIPSDKQYADGLARRWLVGDASEFPVEVGRVLTEQRELIERLERRVRKLEHGQS